MMTPTQALGWLAKNSGAVQFTESKVFGVNMAVECGAGVSHLRVLAVIGPDETDSSIELKLVSLVEKALLRKCPNRANSVSGR